ncbi:glycosyltransferase [bacterium]|nr:glycosyltransferase [bacterium]
MTESPDCNMYKGLSFVIPTKDRPQKIENLLESFLIQEFSCGRIIIVAFGQNIEEVVNLYKDRLPVEYYHLAEGGQIRQRNYGLGLLTDETKLVGFLDDDIVLLPGSLKTMLDFWNSNEEEIAGVGFNVINEESHQYSFLKSLFFASAREPGRILRSGKSTRISDVKEDIQTSWLNGGATIWKHEIIKSYHHQEVKSRWAISEDVIFSYPIGKKYPLYICAEAKVRHEHDRDHTGNQKFYFYGKNKILWNYYFVKKNEDLSEASFFWSVFGGILFKCISAFQLDKVIFQEFIGEIQGIFRILKLSFFGRETEEMLKDT